MKKIIHQFASAPRLFKQIFLVILDALAFPVILWLCYVIRLFDLGAKIIPGIDHGILLVTLIAILSLAITGVYRFIVRTFNEVFIVKLAIAVSLSMIALYTLSTCTQAYIPMSIPFMFGFMMFAWVWISRASIRFIIKASFYSEIGRKRIAIYGAGDAGQQMAAALHRSDDHLPVFFIDDYASLQGQMVGGLKVYSVEKALQRFEKDRIEEILLALPSVGRVRKTEIIQQFENAHLKITELPGLTQLVDGEIQISDIQEVDIIDLLGRDPVPPISHLLVKNIQNKIVMV
ncbi:MAG: polysaccharide biosynthesis protein, partial [Pseudomonadota bacterium]|nr:polysaccharide biosynthesis protein [Pseudomonadota bacterium]